MLSIYEAIGFFHEIGYISPFILFNILGSENHPVEVFLPLYLSKVNLFGASRTYTFVIGVFFLINFIVNCQMDK